MSKDLNSCSFIGRLGKDVELKFMPSGDAVANFSIACNDDYKNKETGEEVNNTDWINIVVFGKLAEICGQYLHKGSKIYISGKMKTRKWQDKEGNNRYSTEVVVNGFNGVLQMLDSKGDGDGSARASAQAEAYQHNSGGSQKPQPSQSRPQPQQGADADGYYDDQIPF